MKRFFSILFLETLAVCALCWFGARAQQTVFVPNCTGNATDDTARFTQLKTLIGTTNTGTIKIPFKANSAQRCKLNDFAPGANITLDNTEGTGISMVNGKALTIAGQVVNPPGKPFFYNALSGQGSVAFTSLNTVYPQWWNGASLGVQVAAANVALPSTGGTVDMQSTSGTIGVNTFSGVTKPIKWILGDRTYVVTVQQSYVTSAETPGLKVFGAGMYNTIIDSQVVSGAVFSLDGSNAGTSDFTPQFGTHLKGFSIIATTSPASSVGIVLRSQWYATIENVRIQGLMSHALQLVNDQSDEDANVFFRLMHCRFQQNGGWGIYMADPAVGQNASGNFDIRGNFIVVNGLGGMRLQGLFQTITQNSFAYNIGSGIHIPYVVAASQTFQIATIAQNEFDGNSVEHIKIDASTNVEIRGNKFITSDRSALGFGFAPTVGVRLGDGIMPNGLSSTTCAGNFFRRDGGTLTAFQINADAATDLDIKNNFWQSSGITKFDGAENATYIEDGGIVLRDLPENYLSTSPASTYAPNLAQTIIHRAAFTATGACTIGAPTNGANTGDRFVLVITNGSGGVITVTFNPIYLIGPDYVNPAAGKTRTVEFYYDPNFAKWVQIGAWSGDQ